MVLIREAAKSSFLNGCGIKRGGGGRGGEPLKKKNFFWDFFFKFGKANF